MTIAIQNAGWEGGVHLINAFIFITVVSAANSSIYIGSRTILFMAKDGGAPKFLGWTNSRGVPVFAIILTNLFGVLSMMNISTGGGKAYSYIINLSGVSTFLVWAGISLTHIRFRQARTPARPAAVQISFTPMERLLWFVCQYLSRTRARLDYFITLRRRNFCGRVHPSAVIWCHLLYLQVLEEDTMVEKP